MKSDNQFADIASYTDNLRKGMTDKLFFLDHLPQNKYLFLDFGCADGSLIEALRKDTRCPQESCFFIGYDISEEMIRMAKQKIADTKFKNVVFTSNWEQTKRWISQKAKRNHFKTVLILSSVVHEVYSYDPSVETFWSRITGLGFDYITVRDMMPSKSIDHATDPVLHQKLLQDPRHVLKANQIADFEQHWGPLNNNKNFVHFLLKYRWTINWNREVKENYFPIYIEDLLKIMESYQTLYLERFRVKQLEERFFSDFGLQIQDDTHVKAVFGRLLP